MKVDTIASAAAASIARLGATMPPNAAGLSSRARRQASARPPRRGTAGSCVITPLPVVEFEDDSASDQEFW